jgi:hypothetical protein
MGMSETEPGHVPAPRKGQGDVKLTREEFRRRLGERFYDPAFDAVRPEIDRILDVAWDGYDEYRKSPRKQRAGDGFAEPGFELPVEWLQARAAILAAAERQRDATLPSRFLLICGAARHDQTTRWARSSTG